MAAKKKVKKKAAAPAKRIKLCKEPMTKSQMFMTIAEDTGLTKKQVAEVVDSLTDIIAGHVKKGGAGAVNVAGLMKIKTVVKPATKARKGINPFTGEEMMFKAKPKSTKIKILPLSKLKEMAN
jgi:nucleoid DNA-binding protein